MLCNRIVLALNCQGLHIFSPNFLPLYHKTLTAYKTFSCKLVLFKLILYLPNGVSKVTKNPRKARSFERERERERERESSLLASNNLFYSSILLIIFQLLFNTKINIAKTLLNLTNTFINIINYQLLSIHHHHTIPLLSNIIHNQPKGESIC